MTLCFHHSLNIGYQPRICELCDHSRASHGFPFLRGLRPEPHPGAPRPFECGHALAFELRYCCSLFADCFGTWATRGGGPARYFHYTFNLASTWRPAGAPAGPAAQLWGRPRDEHRADLLAGLHTRRVRYAPELCFHALNAQSYAKRFYAWSDLCSTAASTT